MDIVKKVRPLKATYESLSFKNKIVIFCILISLVSIVIPHSSEVKAQEVPAPPTMVFEIGDYEDFIDELKLKAEKQYTHEQVVAKLRRQLALNERVKAYLQSYNSPLAPYTSVILQQNNWKKILALANAESSLCRRYPVASANCWGVGGSNLWDMGDNLGEGVEGMNRFLNNYPMRSPMKYHQMTFDQMNGLYKQPPGQHWVDNNMAVWNDLTAIEKSI